MKNHEKLVESIRICINFGKHWYDLQPSKVLIITPHPIFQTCDLRLQQTQSRFEFLHQISFGRKIIPEIETRNNLV